MEEADTSRQRWLQWAGAVYPGRDDIASAAAEAALEAERMGGSEEDAMAAARREVRKLFPQEASKLPADPSRVSPPARPISISPSQAFQFGVFAGCGFLVLLAVVDALLSALGFGFINFTHH